MILMKGSEVAEFAINLHYPEWDTLGREESNLLERISEIDFYQYIHIDVDKINEPIFEIDWDVVKEYRNMPIETMPPIVIQQIDDGRFEIVDGCHRYFAYRDSNKELLAWVGWTIGI